MRIHKEGHKIITIVFLFLLLVNILIYLLSDQLALLLPVNGATLFIFIIILRFFRDPDRTITENQNQIVSPADGTIVAIEDTIEKEFFKDKRKKVSIFMSIYDVHINRFPISGIIKYFKYHPGKYLIAKYPKSSEKNERATVVIESPKNKIVLVRQIAGAVARRIITNAEINQQVVQGDELGFIRFGSRVDLFLPLDTKIHVTMGKKVKGNLSVIGEFHLGKSNPFS